MIELMTIGYEGRSLKEFFAMLARCNVETLIDVREMPLSRKKGFSKTALSAELARHGIKYIHVPELGCPKPVRHAYREDGDWKTYTVRFLSYLKTQGAVLTELASTAQGARCCLMCFEADYNFCHRKYVAEEMINYLPEPFRIKHLTGPISGQVVVPRFLAAA